MTETQSAYEQPQNGFLVINLRYSITKYGITLTTVKYNLTGLTKTEILA